MRQKQNEKRQSQRQGEERDRGATNDWLQESLSYEKKKTKNRYEIKLKKPKKATQKEG